MPEDTVVLRSEVSEKIDEIGGADIIVGIPSYNNARTIGHVVKVVETGLSKYFPDHKSVLVNSDGGSTDGTMDVVNETNIDCDSILLRHRVSGFHKIVTPYQGIPGKGSSFRTIFEIASVFNVKACAVVDADLRSITPEWIDLLIRPVLDEEYDYVAPYYHRHKYDGTITNMIVYPVTRALYGKRTRQPIGGDFGFSGRLASFFLTKDVWGTDVARFGIDIWMTTTAIANNFRICQTFLGAKIHDQKDPSADLSKMLNEVLSSVCSLMEEYVQVWKNVETSVDIPTFGLVYEVGLEPVNINIDRIIEKFRLGVKELSTLYESFLPGEIMWFLDDISGKPKERFSVPDDVWVQIIYDSLVACHKRLMRREHIIKALTPLYLGKVASFVLETWESPAEEVEKRLEELSLSFEEGKEYLLERWFEEEEESTAVTLQV